MNTTITIGNQAQPFYILSAAREATGPLETAARTDALIDQIRGQGYSAARCTGRYNGTDEPRIIVIDPSPILASTFENFVMRLARVYAQESVLAVNADSAARLLFTDGSLPADLGKFTAVTRDIAERADDYTKRLGWYYICVPEVTS